MQQNAYDALVLRLVTELTNDPPRDAEGLAVRWAGARMATTPPVTGRDLAEVRAFVRRWVEVVDAPDVHTRIGLLNALLAEATTYPRIVEHDGESWHLHHRDDGARLPEVLRAMVPVAAAQHLTGSGMHRLGRCALVECRRALVDLTRGGRQRYCSRTCANRDAVRRHRATRRGEPVPPTARAVRSGSARVVGR